MSGPERQVFPIVRRQAIFLGTLNRQAQSPDHTPEWFLTGLERFVNTGDSLENYQAFGKAFPSFWPLLLRDETGKDLSWVPEAHQLFLVYRDLLRRFWTRDRDTSRESGCAYFLFGLLSREEMQQLLAGNKILPGTGLGLHLEKAIDVLRNSCPGLRATPGDSALFFPDWSTGTIAYVSRMDFQMAAWALFRESWRAKVCPKCSTYFLAAKPAQMYCSVNCSTDAHRASSLGWWRQKGSKKRKRANERKRP